MLAQQLINGITLGSTYALVALGYTLETALAEARRCLRCDGTTSHRRLSPHDMERNA